MTAPHSTAEKDGIKGFADQYADRGEAGCYCVTCMTTVDRRLTPPGTELRDLLRPEVTTTAIDIGGHPVLPVKIEPHGVAIHRRS